MLRTLLFTLFTLLPLITAFNLAFYSVGCYNETKKPHGKPFGSDVGFFVKDHKKRCHNTVPFKAKSIFIDPDDDTDDVQDSK